MYNCERSAPSSIKLGFVVGESNIITVKEHYCGRTEMIKFVHIKIWLNIKTMYKKWWYSVENVIYIDLLPVMYKECIYVKIIVKLFKIGKEYKHIRSTHLSIEKNISLVQIIQIL